MVTLGYSAAPLLVLAGVWLLLLAHESRGGDARYDSRRCLRAGVACLVAAAVVAVGAGAADHGSERAPAAPRTSTPA